MLHVNGKTYQINIYIVFDVDNELSALIYVYMSMSQTAHARILYILPSAETMRKHRLQIIIRLSYSGQFLPVLRRNLRINSSKMDWVNSSNSNICNCMHVQLQLFIRFAAHAKTAKFVPNSIILNRFRFLFYHFQFCKQLVCH